MSAPAGTAYDPREATYDASVPERGPRHEEGEPARPARGVGRTLRRVLLGVAAVALVASPAWGPLVLRRIPFFRVRTIEIDGLRYLDPSVVAGRLALDTLDSVFDDADAMAKRVLGHPQVAAVEVERRLPATLVVRVTENQPVALVRATDGFRVYDAAGRPLPIDPSRTVVDVPVLVRRDTALLRLLGELRARTPELYRRISDVRRSGPAGGELVVRLPALPVRAMADVAAERLSDVLLVEADLAKRGTRARELDLRYRDQVVARLP